MMPGKKAEPAEPAQKGPGGRPRKYSDDALVDAAVRVMEREGYAALTIRSLAQELGTSHSTLYNYVGHVEDIEARALHRLTAQLPLPQSNGAAQVRAELVAYLLAVWRLLFQHPGVVFPPIESASWKTLNAIGDAWRGAVRPYAPDEQTAYLALGALVAIVVVYAERDRHYGPDFADQRRRIVGKAPEGPATLEATLEAMIDLVLPGLGRGRKAAGKPSRTKSR